MGNVWPKVATAFLVSHAQLIRVLVQVAYLYPMPKYRSATRTVGASLCDGMIRSVAVGISGYMSPPRSEEATPRGVVRDLRVVRQTLLDEICLRSPSFRCIAPYGAL